MLKVMFIQSFELKGKWSYRLIMKNQLLKNVPNSRLECINHTLFQAKMVKTDIQNGQKNHTLWRPTYLYSLYKGVPPGGILLLWAIFLTRICTCHSSSHSLVNALQRSSVFPVSCQASLLCLPLFIRSALRTQSKSEVSNILLVL